MNKYLILFSNGNKCILSGNNITNAFSNISGYDNMIISITNVDSDVFDYVNSLKFVNGKWVNTSAL